MPLGVENEPVQVGELARPGAWAEQRSLQLPGCVEAVDPGQSHGVEVPVGQPGDVLGLPGMFREAVGFDFSYLHDEVAAAGELEDLLALAVRDPEVPVRVVRVTEDAVDLAEHVIVPVQESISAPLRSKVTTKCSGFFSRCP